MTDRLEDLIRTLQSAQRSLEIRENLENKIRQLEFSLKHQEKLNEEKDREINRLKEDNVKIRETYTQLREERGKEKHKVDCLKKYIERKGLPIPEYEF